MNEEHVLSEDFRIRDAEQINEASFTDSAEKSAAEIDVTVGADQESGELIHTDADVQSVDALDEKETVNKEKTPSDEKLTVEEATPLKKSVPYHERYYLRYQGGKRSLPMDLQGTHAFLQDIGFRGGSLRQAREGTNCAELFRNAESNQKTQMYCSYCGTEISGVEFHHLPDGRLRCTSCSNSLVKTKAEAEELCARVMSNMEKLFGASINVDVFVEMLDERKLKRKSGIILGTPDDQSLMILGTAIQKKNKYSVFLENGAPRISVIATFAHELTHIWQYIHWDSRKDFRKCPPSKRILIYEGMAKWVEIQYLYLIGETNTAKREEFITRNRKDAYGIGFLLYEEYYPLSRDTMTCGSTPFTADRYPFAEDE